MPTFVPTDKCDGCMGQDKATCMYICPHTLMKLDMGRLRSFVPSDAFATPIS